MIHVRFHTPGESRGESPYRQYRILDTTLVSNGTLPVLSAFRDPKRSSTNPDDWRNNPPTLSDEIISRGTSGQCLVSLNGHDVTLKWTRYGVRVDLEIEGQAFIQLHCERGFAQVQVLAQCSTQLMEQLVLGPTMVFLGAARGHAFIHASALAMAGGVIILAGKSGAGKSTLARHLARLIPGCRRLSDDIVVVSQSDAGPVCLPRYPQPGLAQDEQPAGWQTRLPILGAFVLEPPRNAGGMANIKCLSSADSAMGLINHCMGSGLNDRVLDRCVLDTVSSVQSHGISGIIEYPHHAAAPGQIASMIKDYV